MFLFQFSNFSGMLLSQSWDFSTQCRSLNLKLLLQLRNLGRIHLVHFLKFSRILLLELIGEPLYVCLFCKVQLLKITIKLSNFQGMLLFQFSDFSGMLLSQSRSFCTLCRNLNLMLLVQFSNFNGMLLLQLGDFIQMLFIQVSNFNLIKFLKFVNFCRVLQFKLKHFRSVLFLKLCKGILESRIKSLLKTLICYKQLLIKFSSQLGNIRRVLKFLLGQLILQLRI